jgi:23S rRNA (cytosine1962-C5)-methyltransferase
MPLPKITLKPQRKERLHHPWVYDNEINTGPNGDFNNGELVEVIDSRGRSLGVGFLNQRSKIAFRYLSKKSNESIDAQFWKDRVSTAYAYRQVHHGANGKLPPAYRLIHGEADGIPGMVADVYGNFIVVQFLALGLEPWRKVILDALISTTNINGIYERSDSPIRSLEGLEEKAGVVFGEPPPDILELNDAGLTILADIKNGAKTGLFLDQLENQKAAAAQATGREMLNCFSYTGLFGLHATRYGVQNVNDVEISESFNRMSKLQWKRNNLNIPHKTITENVFDYLRELGKNNFRTDMIVLDPPAFTKKRASREAAARGYNEINRMAMKLLRSDGVLVTCSCSHHLSIDEFRSIIQGAAHDAGRTIRLIAQRGQPADHPVLLDAPESEYLKCLILAVS